MTTLILTLFAKILPLYLLIGLGYVAGRVLQINAREIARLLIYLITPIVFFGTTSSLTVTPQILWLPVITFLISATTATISFQSARLFLHDSRANLAGANAATMNSGYFGVPLFIALFGEQDVGIYMLLVMGSAIHEATVSCYILARGNFGVKESLQRLVRLPVVYAGMAGIVCALLGWHLPPALAETITQFRGAYIVLGMMLIGMMLGSMQKFALDAKYLIFAFAGRHLVWPLVACAIAYADAHGLHILTPTMQHALLVAALVPMAANSVAYATEFGVHPEKTATAVFISTFLALITIALAKLFILP